MTCYHCGAVTQAEGDICPICGLPQPAPEGQIPSPAALAYYERVARKKRAETPGDEDIPESRDPEPPVVRRNPNRISSAAQTVRSAGSQGPRRLKDSEKEKPREAPVEPRRSSPSMPPRAAMAGHKAATFASAPPRMVRRYEYEAVGPRDGAYDRFNWVRLCIIAVVCVLMLLVGSYLFLGQSDAGQLWLASMGREASMTAYHQLGRDLTQQGLISRAVEALEIAQSKDPDNLEVLIDLGRAYLASERIDEAEVCFTRAIQVNKVHPEAYRRIIDIMRDQNRNYEALRLSKIAYEQTEDVQFDTLYKQMLPKTPTIMDKNKLGNTFETEIDIYLDCDDESVEIYYTLDGSDPIERGILYERGDQTAERDKNYARPGQKAIHLAEEDGAGKYYTLRAVSFKDDMYSEEFTQSYHINKPRPSMPRSNLAPGTYDTVKTVSLFPRSDKEDVVAIHYTIDGADPTVNSKQFDPEHPIQLRIGTTYLKAIAVNSYNKVSNILVVQYECKGRSKNSMGEEDVVDTLALYRTTMQEFIDTYGKPLSETPDGEDEDGAYTKLAYAFGHAVFFTSSVEGATPVLAELSFRSTAFQGPRGTKVGMRLEEIIGAFRDEGGEENALGQRRLYKRDGGILGIIEQQDEQGKDYKISYYLPVKNGMYIELSYFVKEGLVEHIEWLQYKHALLI